MRKSNVFLGIGCLMGAAIALWSLQQLRAEHERVAVLEQRVAKLNARPAPIAAATPAVVPESAPALPALPTKASTAPVAVPKHNSSGGKQPTDPVIAWQQHEREMMRDPAYRDAMEAEARRHFAQVRADAIRVVGMTPAEADGVIDLWIARNTRFTDLGGIPGRPPTEAMQAELKRAAESEQGQLRDLLGADVYERWNRYLASSSERAEANQFRTELASTAEPLGESQADALGQAIYVERQRRTREYEEYVTNAGITDRYVVSPQDRQRWLDLEKEANGRIHDSVAATLSAGQLARLDEDLEARLAPVETALRMQLDARSTNSN